MEDSILYSFSPGHVIPIAVGDGVKFKCNDEVASGKDGYVKVAEVGDWVIGRISSHANDRMVIGIPYIKPEETYEVSDDYEYGLDEITCPYCGEYIYEGDLDIGREFGEIICETCGNAFEVALDDPRYVIKFRR